MEKEFKDLLAKVDKILEIQELILSKLNRDSILTNETIVSSPATKKLSKKEKTDLMIQRFKEEIELKHQYGYNFQRQFNLVVVPSTQRIRAYLRTKDIKAFDGLKRIK